MRGTVFDRFSQGAASEEPEDQARGEAVTASYAVEDLQVFAVGGPV